MREWAKAAIATIQEAQEKATNQRQTQATQYSVRDRVWLSLENIKTDRPSKKLDQRHAIYTVLEVVGSHAYRLDVPSRIHNVFHTRLLRPATFDPLPGQVVHEPQPPGIQQGEHVEYEVEGILDQKQGRGGSDVYLVKWVGYKKPTWEPFDFVRDLVAMDIWQERLQNGHVPKGGRKGG